MRIETRTTQLALSASNNKFRFSGSARGGPIEGMRRRIIVVLQVSIFVTAWSFTAAAAPPASPDTPDQAAIQEAARWIERKNNIETEYHYVMTAKLRLLLFWAGR